MAERANNGTPIVEMEGVSRIYEMGKVEVRALHDVSLRIYPGELTAIVGPSGSGKTTLLNLIGCLDLPTEGTYRLQGQDVSRLSDGRLSRLRGEGIGFVFQNYSLLNAYNALRNVEMPRYYMRGRGARRRAMALLERVGLKERARHRPTELSGGEQQRVAVARAIVKEPALILADEPTGNLDTSTGDRILELITERCRESSMALLMVTHTPLACKYADRILKMVDGVVTEDETCD